MRKYIYCFFLLFFFSNCYNSLPDANITNIKISKFKKKSIILDGDENPFYYQLALHFDSNVDLDSLRENTSAAMKFRLHCPLDGTNDYDLMKMSKRSLYIESYSVIKDSLSKHTYNAEFNFIEGDTINGSTTRYLEKQEVIDLLKDKKCIPCKVYTTFYFTGRSPYFSEEFCVPPKDILKALE